MAQQSRIGPLALEAPLGPRTIAGQVFRAIHVEQRKLLAVRVFPVPLGMTPESRHAFAQQIEQLKQLRHDGIVRCYGGGFDARNAYLVYQLIDGESLETALARRGRYAWETAFEYAQRLSDTLQIAHVTGWVHGRIRPDKLLIERETDAIRINDFRREAIASALGNQPPQLKDMPFMAPEQFEPNFVPNEKCDLYAIGAILYTMLVGEPPFSADSPNELLPIILTQPAPSVQSKVYDCPIWLSAVIDQLLSKDPRSRPYSAAAVQLAFKEAQRRQEQGVGVLQHAAAGFSPLKLNADRDEAEKILGIKPKKVRKESESSFWERPLFLVPLLLLCISIVVWFLLPLGEATLRARSETLLASEDWTQWEESEPYLSQLIERFPNSPNAIWAQEKMDFVHMMAAERRIERDAARGRAPRTEAERQYSLARSFEKFGDRISALEMYRSMEHLLADDPADKPVIDLARRQIALIEQDPKRKDLREFLESKLAEAEDAYESNRVSAARQLWESIVTLYEDNRDLTDIVARADERLDDLKKGPKRDTKKETKQEPE
ncbi:MAG: serine/threonine-protein kinase [Pirellulales bacterium]